MGEHSLPLQGARRVDALSPAFISRSAATPRRVPVLPAFDEWGNVPSRDHEFVGGSTFVVGLAELRERFVEHYPESETRALIWAGWMQHRRRLLERGINFETWVDGSFCTDKLNPADVDLCVVFEGPQVDALPPDAQQELRILLDPTYCKRHFRCDPHGIAAYDFMHARYRQSVRQMIYWSRVFGSDRADHKKAILIVQERGVL